MAITATTPFTLSLVETADLRTRLTPAVRREVAQLMSLTNRPFWNDGADWPVLVAEEELCCHHSFWAYHRHSDKRKRAAKTAEKLWLNHCLRLFFFRAYAAEAAHA